MTIQELISDYWHILSTLTLAGGSLFYTTKEVQRHDSKIEEINLIMQDKITRLEESIKDNEQRQNKTDVVIAEINTNLAFIKEALEDIKKKFSEKFK